MPLAAVLVALLLWAVPARAELMGDVAQFLQDYDRLAALRNELDGDRDAMAASINDHQQLVKDVKAFFADRAEVAALVLLKAADRKQMRVTLDYKPAKLEKPVKGTGVLADDANSFISFYDAWVSLKADIEADIAGMRNAVAANDPAALAAVVTAFFDHHRARLQKRLQWQSDIRAMKKDIAFKGTGKPVPPEGGLKKDVEKFLADRDAWESYASILDADRNNIRTAVSSGQGLEDAVRAFLTDRRYRHIKGVELWLDRKAMRKDVGLGGSEKEAKQGSSATSKSLDSDDESDALEQTADTAGER
jgi:hypothetical protein